MKFTRNGSMQVVAGMIVGVGALVGACGGDDDTTSSSSSSGGSSGGSSGTASSSGATTDGGGEGGEAGEAGAKKATGEGPCTTGADCQSGECFVPKKAGDSYCSIKCTMMGQNDTTCTALGAAFTGKCNGEGYCQKTQ